MKYLLKRKGVPPAAVKQLAYAVRQKHLLRTIYIYMYIYIYVQHLYLRICMSNLYVCVTCISYGAGTWRASRQVCAYTYWTSLTIV